MAIVKHSSRVARLDGDLSLVSGGSFSDNLTEPRIGSSGLSEVDSGMGSDGCYDSSELEGPGTELCQVGDQCCRLPLELYDLPDLSSILSVETWNNCLSEEERFSLAAYLPDLDQETFARTLTELFSGRNFHFGSPVSVLFDKLKGGKLEASVTLSRRGVNFFQRRQHYFFLREYHDSMVDRIISIKEAWESCAGYGIKERLRVLNTMRSRRSRRSESDGFARPGTDSEDEGSSESFWNKRLMVARNDYVSKCYLPAKFEAENTQGILKADTPKEKGRLAMPKLNRADGFELGTARTSSSQMRVVGYGGFLNSLPNRQTNQEVTIASYRRDPHDMAKNARNVEKDRAYPVKDQTKHRVEYHERDIGRKKATMGEVLKTSSSRTAADSKGKYNRAFLEQIGDSHYRYDPRTNIPVGNRKSKSVQKEGRSMAHSRGNDSFDQNEDTESDSSDQVDPDRYLCKSDYMHDVSVHMEARKGGLHQASRSQGVQLLAVGSEKRGQVADAHYDEAVLHEESKKPPAYTSISNKRKGKVEPGYVDEFDTSAYPHSNPKMQIDHFDHRRKKGKWSTDNGAAPLAALTPDSIIPKKEKTDIETEATPAKKPFTLITPTIHTGFSFSIIHLLSSVRKAMVATQLEDTVELQNHVKKEDGMHELGREASDNMDAGSSEDARPKNLPSLTVHEIVNRVRLNPGDPCILETQEPLHDLVRGVLKIFSSKTAPLGAKGWKALVLYERLNKGWCWIGPTASSLSDNDTIEEETSSEAWGIPHKMLVKLVDAFANWLKNSQEILKQIGSLPEPPIAMLQHLDEKERFRDLKTQKCPNTISPSSAEARAYFRREEVLRYMIPDRAFSYTAADGKKSTVAPLRRGGGKLTSKGRDHFMLKTDRPPHVTNLCLVRDAAARLPGSIGTRADVSTLIRDSQYIAEDVSDARINQVISGALDRLHYERDPCVQFDGERKLWVYLHSDREEEDFEDDCTSSTKKWKKPTRKDAMAHSDMAAVNDANLHEDGDTAQVGYSAEYESNPEPSPDSTPIHIGQKKGPVHNDTRYNIECQALRSNAFRESKMQCQENSSMEAFDDEHFGRGRPTRHLSSSLL